LSCSRGWLERGVSCKTSFSWLVKPRVPGQKSGK